MLRSAVIPKSLVGVYAAPLKVRLHFRHFQTPTLTRLTARNPQFWQGWLRRNPTSMSATRSRTRLP